jgi:hypothetical protein
VLRSSFCWRGTDQNEYSIMQVSVVMKIRHEKGRSTSGTLGESGLRIRLKQYMDSPFLRAEK